LDKQALDGSIANEPLQPGDEAAAGGLVRSGQDEPRLIGALRGRRGHGRFRPGKLPVPGGLLGPTPLLGLARRTA
jgi:hypothetical protein